MKRVILRPVHTNNKVARNSNKVVGNGDFVAVSGNNLFPFSATLLPGVDRPLGL